jgi:HEAT repeat protein
MMGIRRVVLVLLCALVSCMCSSNPPETELSRRGFTPPDPFAAKSPRLERKGKLAKILKQKEFPTEAQIRELGAGVDSDLVDILNHKGVQTEVRLRAVRCLGYFQNRRARVLLRSVLTDPVWEQPFRIAALVALAHSKGDEAYETIKDFTLDADRDMRLTAVHALLVLGSADALNLLKTIQLRENDPKVLEAMDKAIRELEKSKM